MERRMRGNSYVRCEVGENPEITSRDYLSLSAPCILFACLIFTLTAPLYIWSIIWYSRIRNGGDDLSLTG